MPLTSFDFAGDAAERNTATLYHEKYHHVLIVDKSGRILGEVTEDELVSTVLEKGFMPRRKVLRKNSLNLAGIA